MKSLNLVLKEEAQISAQLLKELGQNEPRIRHGRWNELKMNEICPLIVQWKAQKLWMEGCRQEDNNQPFLRDLTFIKFSCLKFLQLFSNRLESIEGLHRIEIPFLELLSLRGNKINRISDLRKANYQYLDDLQLQQNQLKDGKDLEECEFPKLKNLYIQWCTPNLEQMPGSCQIMKMKIPNADKIYINSQRRIKQQRFFRNIQRKCQNAFVSYFGAN